MDARKAISSIFLLLAVTLWVVDKSFDVTPGPAPIVPGPRTVLIIHETEDDSAEHANLFISLQADEDLNDEHDIVILDKDLEDENGNPLPWLQPYLNQIGDSGLPAMFILAPAPDSQSESVVLWKGPLPKTKDDVEQLITKYGG